MTDKTKNIDRLAYMSYSKLRCWEQDKNRFYQTYVENLESYKNKYLTLGKRMATTLEVGYDEERDENFELAAVFMPKFPEKEKKMEWVLEGIKIVGILDGWDENKLEVHEVKTGKLWTKSLADKSDQLTFYSLLCFLNYKSLPKKIFLHWLETKEDEAGNLSLTGKLTTFETKRTLRDIILLTKRIRTAWTGIQEMKLMINK